MDQATSLRKIAQFSKTQAHLKKFGYSTSEEKNKKVGIISVTSGKGGVGKTNIVGNLAYSMSLLGKKVLVLDADLGLGNMDVLLGLTPKYNLLHVFMGMKRIEDIIIEGPGGILILPAASGVEELTNLSDEQKLHILSEFERLDLDIDILLVDTSAGISSNVMYFNSASQHIIVIATPDPASITDAYALIKVLSLKYAEKKFNLIVNCASSKNEANNVYDTISKATEEFLHVSVNYLGFIPRDVNFITSIRQQKLITQFNPHSEASLAIKSLAQKIDSLTEICVTKGNIQFFWNRLINGISPEDNDKNIA
ncbi:MAG: MinD/ParA family protein [Candidatus Schekmanbacteria bacterium]|nr:MAG: MinD/ParA family protein [Candidatus Schekmanbacteria bacterium]